MTMVVTLSVINATDAIKSRELVTQCINLRKPLMIQLSGVGPVKSVAMTTPTGPSSKKTSLRFHRVRYQILGSEKGN